MDSPADFLSRNAVDVLPKGALEARLAEGRPLRVKLGLDPTARDLHLGHTVVLQKLREFQDLGHTVVLIVGDYTARVGDPSGRSATRPVLSPEEIDAHARTYIDQVGKVLLHDERLEVRKNSEWLQMEMEDLFRVVRTVTVAQLLERDDFAKRFAASEPISLLELLYPVLQGYDSVCIDADVELGGTDQTFNLLMGREVQRAYGQEPQAVLTTHLLEGLDGVRKMSKSLDNYVALTDPPDEMFEKLMSLQSDALIPKYELLCTDLGPADHARVVAGLADGSIHPNHEKRRMARTVVDRYHGAGAGEAAEAAFDRVHKRRELPEEVPERPVPATVIRTDPHRGWFLYVPALLEALGVVESRSEARRLLAQGGVRVDGESESREQIPLEGQDLGPFIGSVWQVGRRRFARVGPVSPG